MLRIVLSQRYSRESVRRDRVLKYTSRQILQHENRIYWTRLDR